MPTPFLATCQFLAALLECSVFLWVGRGTSFAIFIESILLALVTAKFINTLILLAPDTPFSIHNKAPPMSSAVVQARRWRFTPLIRGGLVYTIGFLAEK